MNGWQLRTGFLWALCFSLAGFASQPQWNPGGNDVFRIFRVDRPTDFEHNAASRIGGELDQLREKMTHEEDTEGADSSGAIRLARLKFVEGGKRILGKQRNLELYELFLVALDNRKLKQKESFSLPPLDRSMLVEVSDLLSTAPLRDGPGSGLVQFAIFHGFLRHAEGEAEVDLARDLVDRVIALDHYLTKIGISGLREYIEPILKVRGKERFFDAFWEQLRSGRVAMVGGVGACALALASWYTYANWISDPTHDRLDKIEQRQVNPQKAADTEAGKLGDEIFKDLTPGH